MLFVLILLAAWAFIRFIIGGNEDSWICVNGQWVKHGSPSAPKPEEACDSLQKSETEDRNFSDTSRITVVASDLEIPWALAFLPDKSFLFTERPGRVRMVDTKGNLL